MKKTVAEVHPNVSLNRINGRLKKSLPIYMLIIPSMLLLFAFHYMPIFGVLMAFKDFSPIKGILGSKWVGFRNFSRFLFDENYWRVMRNTIIINIYSLVFAFPVPILFALFLNELWSNRFKKLVQTISYLPHFISWVVAAGIVTTILSPTSGIVNNVLNRIFGMEPIYFLIKKSYWRSIYITTGIWKGFGLSSVYYIASLSSIDPELYMSASIDGAGRFKQAWHITLPGIKSIMIILLILRIGGIISIGFESIFLLYNPIVYDVADVISTYTYRLGIEQTQYSLTAAIGLTQSAVNFILVYSANRLSRKVAGWSMW